MMIWRGLSPKLIAAAFDRRRSIAGGAAAGHATEKPGGTGGRHAPRPHAAPDRASTGKPRSER